MVEILLGESSQLSQILTSPFIIVKGDLPKSIADTKLAEHPLDVKEILASYTKNRGKKSITQREDYDDDELKQAIKMSLIENDLDLDNSRFSNKLYTSLAHEQPQTSGYSRERNQIDEDDEEAQLRKAIEMSMEKETTSNQQQAAASQPLDPNEVRRKRLEFLEKSQNK